MVLLLIVGVLVVMVVVLFVLLGVICGVCSVYGVSSAISGTNSGSDVSGINCVNGLVVLVQFGESRHVLSASHHLQEVLSLPSSIVQYMPSPPRGLVPALQYSTVHQSFRWGVFSPEFGKNSAKPIVKSP